MFILKERTYVTPDYKSIAPENAPLKILLGPAGHPISDQLARKLGLVKPEAPAPAAKAAGEQVEDKAGGQKAEDKSRKRKAKA